MPTSPPAWSHRPTAPTCPERARPAGVNRDPPHSRPNARLSPYWRGETALFALEKAGAGGDSPASRISSVGDSISSMKVMPGRSKRWLLAARLCALALVVAALPACSWFGKDDVIPDDPADKLYNEGLYLLNNKKDYKMAAKRFEEVDRQHPYSEWARKALIMSAYAHYEGTAVRRLGHGGEALRDPASGQPGRGLRAVPDRLVLFRPDPRHHPRPGAHRARDAGARRGGAQISQHRICRRRPSASSRSRATSSPARKWTSRATIRSGANTSRRSTASRW